MNRNLGILAVLALTSLSTFAAATADASVTGIVDTAKATYDAILVIALPIAGTFLAFAMGKRVWKRFAK
jgi:hypothetical protein